MNQSIFSDDNKMSGTFWKYENVGDKVEGTLVDVREVPHKYQPGQMQKIYELQTADGEIVLVGGKPGIDVHMKHVNLGQIVGLEFTATKPTSKGNDAKIVSVYSNPKFVNEDWLEMRKLQATFNEASEEEVEDEAPSKVAEPDFSAEGELFQKILELAGIKLGATDEDSAKLKVMEALKVAFIPVNYQQIHDALAEMK